MQKLHRLIEQEVTGTPKELAKRMHVSERSVYGLIEQLKDYEASICYSRSRRTYYYSDDFEFKVNISIQVKYNDIVTEVFDNNYFRI